MRGGEVRVIFAKGKCDLSELCKGNIFFFFFNWDSLQARLNSH